METEITAAVIRSMAFFFRYLSCELEEIADTEEEKERERKEEEARKKEENKHPWKYFWDNGIVKPGVGYAVARGFDQRYHIAFKDLCVEDFATITEKQMMRFRGMGKVGMTQVKKVMDAYGVKFKGEE